MPQEFYFSPCTEARANRAYLLATGLAGLRLRCVACALLVFIAALIRPLECDINHSSSLLVHLLTAVVPKSSSLLVLAWL